MKKYFSLMFIVLLIAGCGGGGGGSSTPPNPTPTSKYTITFTSDSNGIISGSASQQVTANGSATAVTAVGNNGYHFVNWTDASTNAVISTANPLTISTVTANQTIKANFTADSASTSWQVSFGTGTGSGSITGTLVQNVTNGASASTVTAVPSPGFVFTNWIDGNNNTWTTPSLTLTNVISAMTLTANFVSGPYLSASVTGDGMTASFPTTNAIVDDGHGLNSTVESFDVTVAVANIPSGATYQVLVAASDASGNIIPLYNNLPDLSSTTNYLVINGSGATAAATASLPAGATGAGYLLPVGTGTGHWTIISITRTN